MVWPRQKVTWLLGSSKTSATCRALSSRMRTTVERKEPLGGSESLDTSLSEELKSFSESGVQ